MKLSVIIPLYNAEQYIDKCLDSVFDCDLDKAEYEVIVVDDGSEDNGLAIVRAYAEQYSNIRVFHQENQGQSVARNYGIKEAKGDYIWFVDSDDYVDAAHISSILEKMGEKDVEICRFQMKHFRIDGSVWLNVIANVQYDKIYRGEQVLINCIDVSSICNGFFLREFLIRNNLVFYPGIIHQDSEYGIRSAALAQRMMFVNNFLYYYRYNSDSCTRNKSIDKKLKSHISDVVIARNIRLFAKQNTRLSDELKLYLINYATSIMKGRLLSYLIQEDDDSLILYNSVVEKAIAIGEYPIKTKDIYLKSKVVCCLLNNHKVMSVLIKLRNIF